MPLADAQKKSSSSAPETPMLPTIRPTGNLAPFCPTGTESQLMRAIERRKGLNKKSGPNCRTGPKTKQDIPLLMVVVLIMLIPGCSNLTPAVFKHPSETLPGMSTGPNVKLAGIESERVYHKVREAASTHSVVLEIVGEDAPIRVLPLPPDGRSVFVSNLLKDTGILEKMGTIEATLYRNSKDSIGGIRMKVKMNSSHDSVRPESDYALLPGDRLRVRKVEHVMLTNLVNGVIGL